MLMHIYESRAIPIPIKIKLLILMEDLASKRSESLPISFNWRFYWSELMTHALRQYEAGGPPCNQGALESLSSKLALFLHTARRFIPAEQSNIVLLEAMNMLKDTSRCECTEGLVLLVRFNTEYFSM